MKSCGIGYLYVEVANHEVRKIEPCQLEQQLIFAYGVGIIHEHKGEIRIPFIGKSLGIRGVLICHHGCTAVPYIAHAEITAHKGATLTNTIYNHTCKFAHLTLRICLYECVESGKTSVGIALVELAKS